MSSLIDTMNPQKKQWRSHAARILSTNIAFNLVYLPGAIGVGGIIAGRIFIRTSAGMQILFHILMCFSLAAYSNFFATFFRKAQLSGITIVILSCILAIIAQWAIPSIAIAQAIVAILLPPINYTLWTIYLADAESFLRGASTGAAPARRSGGLPGYFPLVAAFVQIILFLLLTLLAERLQYGTTSSARKADKQLAGGAHALKIENFSRTYKPSLWARIRPWKRAETVHAVNKLSFAALRGQLIALLGENGSGKTTTISAITAQERVNSGVIELDGTGGLGFCPQKNVLWDELTVLEHVRIFNQLKSASRPDSAEKLRETASACDLGHKLKAKTKTLSGGQKRKVQLAMAFTGGSKVCCIDEASSGLDPVSRRKIWDILLSERGHRTLLFTTHALDEADALSDHIVILQKGRLKMEGSAVELKQRYGGDYQIHIQGSLPPNFPIGDNIRHEARADGHIFHISRPDAAGQFIGLLDKHGMHDYEVQGPTIEQVFLRQAEHSGERASDEAGIVGTASRPGTGSGSDIDSTTVKPKGVDDAERDPQLAESRTIGFFGQVWVLFRKRMAIFPRNWVPYFFALLIPIITAGLATSFLRGFEGLNCSPDALAVSPGSVGLANFLGRGLPVGPTSEIDESRLESIFAPYTGGFGVTPSQLIAAQDTYTDWESYIRSNFRIVAPGGYWIGDQSAERTLAYRADGGLGYAATLKAGVDAYLLNIPIGARFSNFALPLAGSLGDSLQLVIYFGLAMSVAPGLFALYPSYERTRNIKALQYSNGVRPAPLWLAHLLFDSIFVLIISSAALAIFVNVRGEVWFSIGHLWPVFFFYGLSSILFAYVASLFLSTQLGAFAFAAGYQAVTLVLYFFM
jgi:ATP-binding cassette, subfamily A (ABC1), member 3